jgi:hypothetical protein
MHVIQCGENAPKPVYLVHSLRAVYLATNPLVSAIAFSGALAGLLFIAAEINTSFAQAVGQPL